MHIDLYGLSFNTPLVTVYLWSPWRCMAIEHRLFESIKALSGTEFETGNDEWRLILKTEKAWKSLLLTTARILKGWQEEGTDSGSERRLWHWLVEGDTDDHGYDHTGERTCLWAFLRLTMQRGSPDETDDSEFLDLNGFGVQIHCQED